MSERRRERRTHRSNWSRQSATWLSRFMPKSRTHSVAGSQHAPAPLAPQYQCTSCSSRATPSSSVRARSLPLADGGAEVEEAVEVGEGASERSQRTLSSVASCHSSSETRAGSRRAARSLTRRGGGTNDGAGGGRDDDALGGAAMGLSGAQSYCSSSPWGARAACRGSGGGREARPTPTAMKTNDALRLSLLSRRFGRYREG